MDFSTAKSTLNTEIGDGDNFTFTDAEKTRALTRAWNDTYVVEEDRDTSLTYDVNTARYALPANTNGIITIYHDSDSDGFEHEVPVDAYTTVDGYLQLDARYKGNFTDGNTIVLYRWKKLTTDDSISDENLQEYVLALAMLFTTRILMQKRGNRFLKNDTTMAEIVAMRNEAQDTVNEYRRKQKRVWQEV